MLCGAGLGWRGELAADLLARPRVVDFVEVVAETCFVQSRLRREARAIAQIWPVVPHGVKLSLGSADGIDPARARQLGDLARELAAPLVSEHVAFTRGRNREIGHLTQLPRTREAVAVVARNVARARRHLPDIPLLLENVAFSLRWPDDEMDEPTFYREIVEATGCDLLLDLANLYANATNEGLDPSEVLAAYPLDRVAMVHLAGGELEAGFYFDTHAAGIRAEVWALLEALLGARPGVPVLIERDADFGPFDELAAEVERARALLGAAPRRQDHRPAGASGGSEASFASAGTGLADAQHELAVALTDLGEPASQVTARFGADALGRTRDVLRRKRVDDALPLVPRIAAFGDAARALAIEAVAAAARAPRAAGIADAMRIAEAAAADPRFAAAAAVDRLVLRARFVGPDRTGVMRGRVLPYVGRTDRLWAVKAFGPSADVHLIERQP